MNERVFEVQPIVEQPSVEEQAYLSIREAITSGRIKPGTQLRQIGLANDLGVSQRTVRQALAQLHAEGLVAKDTNKGYKTLSPDVQSQKELYEIRLALEGIAMEYAARRIQPDDLARMRRLLPLTGRGNNPDTAPQVREANREFHWIAIRASGLPHVIRMLSQVWDLIMTYYDPEQYAEGKKGGNDLEDIQAHEELITALAEGDGPKAREINTAHLLSTVRYLTSHMKDGSLPD